MQNISALVDGSVVSLTPMINATTKADTAVDMGKGLYGWICGASAASTVTGPTTILAKYLPGSCRGS